MVVQLVRLVDQPEGLLRRTLIPKHSTNTSLTDGRLPRLRTGCAMVQRPNSRAYQIAIRTTSSVRTVINATTDAWVNIRWPVFEATAVVEDLQVAPLRKLPAIKSMVVEEEGQRTAQWVPEADTAFEDPNISKPVRPAEALLQQGADTPGRFKLSEPIQDTTTSGRFKLPVQAMDAVTDNSSASEDNADEMDIGTKEQHESQTQELPSEARRALENQKYEQLIDVGFESQERVSVEMPTPNLPNQPENHQPIKVPRQTKGRLIDIHDVASTEAQSVPEYVSYQPTWTTRATSTATSPVKQRSERAASSTHGRSTTSVSRPGNASRGAYPTPAEAKAVSLRAPKPPTGSAPSEPSVSSQYLIPVDSPYDSEFPQLGVTKLMPRVKLPTIHHVLQPVRVGPTASEEAVSKADIGEPIEQDQDEDEPLLERLQAKVEIETREFKRTMGQGMPKGRSKKKTGKKHVRPKVELPLPDHLLPSSSGAQTTPEKPKLGADNEQGLGTEQVALKVLEQDEESGNVIVGRASENNPQGEPEPLATDDLAERHIASDRKGTVQLPANICEILEAGRAFRGHLSYEVQIGKVLIGLKKGASKDLAEYPIAEAAFKTRLDKERADGKATLDFTSMVSTSATDSCQVLNLELANGDRLFEATPHSIKVMYEMGCVVDVDGRRICVEVDQDRHIAVYHPEQCLGEELYMYSKRIWDARFSMTGSSSLQDTPLALERLLGTLKASITETENHSLGLPVLDWVSDGKNADVKRVLLKRILCYCSTEHPQFALQIVEVQDLHVLHKDDGINWRAKALSPAEMIDHQRLWYEVGITPADRHPALDENLTLEIGDDATWRPEDILSPQSYKILKHLTTQLVTRIDGIGADNKGPRGHDADLRVIREKEQRAASEKFESMNYFW